MDKRYAWSQEKNRKLIEERNVSFEAVVAHIEAGDIVDVVSGKGGFSHQKQFIVIMNQYVYIVPYVEDDEKVFLKTVIPSRQLTKRYLSGGGTHEKI